MLKFFFLFSMVALVAAAPPHYKANEEAPTLVNFMNNNNGLGPYNFSYETSDGVNRQETAEVINPNDPENSFLVVKGTYSFIAPDGTKYSYEYIADANGYRVNRVA